MKQFFAYIRVSTVKQGERGSSLQEQRSAIETYARRHDLVISQWFEEKETAAKRGRRFFSGMLAALDAGEADGVIMHKIDRSARNLRDWSDLGELIDRGIAVHFAHESVDLNSRGGRLSADIQAVVAADYVRNLRDEVRKGFFGRLKQGLYPLPAPRGYLDRGRGQPKEIDPVTGPLVRAAFELYASGTHNLDTLAKELYRRGLRTHSGKPIPRASLSDLLHNSFYIGLIEIRRTGQLFQGIHKPLVSKAIFDRVQAVLNGEAAHHGLRHAFLFQRLLRCQHCGYRLTAERQKGRAYYRCQTKGCPTTCLREDIVEHAVIASLEPLSLAEEECESLKILALSLRAEWATRREEERNSVELNLRNANARLDRLTDAFLDGAIERELFENRKRTLILEQKELRERYEYLTSDDQPLANKLSEFLELAKTASLSYQSGNLYEKRDLLKSVTSNFVVDRKNVVIELRKPFDALANRQKNSDGGPYRTVPRTVLLGMTRGLLESWAEIKEFIETCPWKPAKREPQRGQNLIEINRKRKKERKQRDQAL